MILRGEMREFVLQFEANGVRKRKKSLLFHPCLAKEKAYECVTVWCIVDYENIEKRTYLDQNVVAF